MEAFLREREQLKKEAKTALDAEMAREKAANCPNAGTTLAINTCLSAEVAKTNANFRAYTGALRQMLAQPKPWGEPNDASGPTGKPLTQQEMLANFDQTEIGWRNYKAAMCKGAFGLYQSGSIAPSIAATCELLVMRSHMRELAAVYGDFLSR